VQKKKRWVWLIAVQLTCLVKETQAQHDLFLPLVSTGFPCKRREKPQLFLSSSLDGTSTIFSQVHPLITKRKMTVASKDPTQCNPNLTLLGFKNLVCHPYLKQMFFQLNIVHFP